MVAPTDTYELLHYNMVHAHNTFKLGYDTILSNLESPPQDDLKNFLGYCEAWALAIESHHTSEEEVVFPFLNQKMDFSGEKAQHEVIHANLDKLLAVIVGAKTDPTKFDAASLKALMDEFKEPLYTHLDDELEHISAQNLKDAQFEEPAVKALNQRLEAYAKSHGDPFLLVPFMRRMSPVSNPVSIAERILQLTQTHFNASSSGSEIDPLALYNAKNTLQDLCNELLRNALGSLEYTVLLAESSALGFVNRLGVADVIADKAVPLNEISVSTGSDPRFLSIALSCLSKHNYFEEVGGFGSQVYRNNELSDLLREDHPQSLKDAVGFVCDEGLKATSYLLEASRPSVDSTRRLTAASHAFAFNGTIFEWMASQEWRGRRMGKAMQQLHRMANGNVVADYPWNQLNSPIVDVGGGIGSLELVLLKQEENSSLNFRIFDIPATIENAKKTWASQPESASSRVSFTSGNFLAPTLDETQLPLGLPTYLIRHVLHDWTDDQVVTILTNVRHAMQASSPSTPGKLVLCEMLLRESSARFVRTTSMQLLALNNGVTRTENEMVKLLEKSGFKMTKVHHMRAVDSIIEAIPEL
ncbi:hypothetical protein H0H93_006002 [Arthromyces matolae]|nr:hypothetical protein H0H93_006002 [Arthromyces matolae]